MTLLPRRQRALLSPLGITQLHLRNPWVMTFFSFSFPGFGNLLQGRYLKAFTLIGWEIFINTHANINLGIMYSLLGEFDKSKETLHQSWLLLYVSIYFYAIWDSYRGTIDLNHQYILADREDTPIPHIKFSTWDVNFLDKREPLLAVAWSILAPGLGHLYIHKVLSGFFIFGSTIALMALSHLPQGIYYMMFGNFSHSTEILNMQWTLYLPSVYSFIFYDAYQSTVEQNKLFEKEQSSFFRRHYQKHDFKMPI